MSCPFVSCFLQARAATEDLETYTKAYEARSFGAANHCKQGAAESVVFGHDSYFERPLCHEAVDTLDVVQIIVHEWLHETILLFRTLSHHVSSPDLSPLPP